VANNGLIDQLVTQWEDLRSRGEETSVEDLCRDHPELLDTLREALRSRETRFTEAWDEVREFDPEATCDVLGPARAGAELEGLDAFQVVRLLAEGGMGSVYEAVDRQLGRPVALKVMRAQVADLRKARERFLREARAAAALADDHIVRIYQVGEHKGVPFLTMPLLHGQTLNERLKEGPRLSNEEVLRIGREVAEGLAAAHAQGLIHRDIKPANIWLEEGSGRVKILDFGLARAANEAARLTQDGSILGTPAFMAPEQASGSEDLDHRSDLFSLGSVLYRMVTGRLPFPAENMAELLLALVHLDPVPPRKLDATVPRALNDLILELMAKDPADRPRSAGAVVEAIRALEQRATRDALPELDLHVEVEDAGSSREPPTSWRFWAAVAALIVAVVVGITSRVALLPSRLDVEANTRERSRQSPQPDVAVAVKRDGQTEGSAKAPVASVGTEDAVPRTDLGSTDLELAELHWKAGRLVEGMRSSRRGLELIEKTLRLDPANQGVVSQLANAHLAAGRKYWSLGLIREAADHLNRSFQLIPPAGPFRG